MKRIYPILLLTLPLAGGCQFTRTNAVPESTSRPAIAPVRVSSALSREALLTLDEIETPAELPASRPATMPTGEAPLEAIQLFARARAALQEGHRFTAVQLLDEALAIDPWSFELNLAMGQASAGTTLGSRAMPALERAAEINPDDPRVHLEMARLQVAAGDHRAAIKSLRRAQQTTAYRRGEDSAVAIDYTLARTLQLAGFDTAAIQQYENLLNRMARTSSLYRGPIEVMQAMRSPDLVFNEIAQLAARLGDYRKALSAIEQAMLEEPDNLQYAITRVRLLQMAGRGEDARQFMPRLISRFGYSVEISTLLREVYGSDGEEAAINALRTALNDNPNDARLGFSLASLLESEGDIAGAETILKTLARSLNYRQDVTARLHDFYDSQGRTIDAARVLIEASAQRPEDLSEYAGRMGRLARLSRRNHLRLPDLQKMQVDEAAEPARLYWVAWLAQMWQRDELGRSTLERSVRLGDKPYPPAYRALIGHYWARRDWDQQRKIQTSQELVDQAVSRGDNYLAAELRGIIALHLNKIDEASAALLESMRATTSPEILLTYAEVQVRRKNLNEAERILLKITEEYPLFEQAYAALINFYREHRQNPSQALRTLQRWIAADPNNPSARALHGLILLEIGRREAAEKMMLDLFEEHADNEQVLQILQFLYQRTNRLGTYIRMLEQKWQDRPDIREIAEQLVGIYAQQQRMADAMRVLGELRSNAAGDSDLLYYVSHLYLQVDDRKTAEEVLEEVLRVDPNHSSAANDLGYFMAEENRDLDRAMELVTIAVREEPDNQAFLDSYGWVLYKRGRFEEAVDYLERAIAQTVEPDPIVLDHLGDAYYRVGRVDDALKKWTESNEALARRMRGSPDHRKLQLQLQSKLRQLRRKQQVEVAPTAAEVEKTS